MKQFLHKGILIIRLVVFCSTISTNAQLIVNPMTPSQLAAQLAGSGVSIFNVSYTGDATAASGFTGTGTNIGINSGIMLATGPTSIGIGPNNIDDAGVDMLLPGDFALDTLANTATFDATVLEFDFIPQNDTVTFRYVFASEEYPEFVCSMFNDAFAFFISGPGIPGFQNMALIPGTTSSVAINSVNGGLVGSNGLPGAGCVLNYSNFYVDNTGGTTIQFDGFTTVLTAQAIVIPCETYHLRLSIADAGDGIYDSGVFFETGSLSSVAVLDAGPDLTFCSGQTASLGSVAIPGWTYNWSPATGLSNPSISNPDVTITTNVNASYTYISSANNGTCTLTDTVVVTVAALPSSTFIPPSTTICNAQTVQFTYTGSAPATANYTWNFGGGSIISGTGQGPYTISYSSPSVYNVSLTVDNLGCISPPSTAQVTVGTGPLSSFAAPSIACINDIVNINFTGVTTSTATALFTAAGATIISGSGTGPYQITYATPGNYSISMELTDGSCPPSLSQQAISIGSSQANAGNDVNFCSGSSATIGDPSAVSGTTYLWFPVSGLSNPNIPDPVVSLSNPAGASVNQTYILTTNTGGCVAYDTVLVTVNSFPLITLNTIPDTICAGDSILIQGNLSASSSALINWNFNSGNIIYGTGVGPYQISYPAGGSNQISIAVDDNGCISTASDVVFVNVPPSATFALPATACNGDTLPISYSGTSSSGTTFNWNFGNANVVSGNNSGPYLVSYTNNGSFPVTLEVDNGACSSTETLVINIGSNQLYAGTDKIICSGDSVLIGGAAVGNTVYSWLPSSGLNNSTLAQPSATLFNASSATTVLTYICSATQYNCIATDTVLITVNPTPTASFSALPDTICIGQQEVLSFNGISLPSATSTWNFGSAIANGTGTGPYTIDFPNPGLYTISLNIVQTGCTSDYSDQVYVNPEIIPAFASPAHACTNDTLQINYTGDGGALTYNWNFNGGNIISGNNAGPFDLTWNTNGMKIISLEITSAFCPPLTVIDSIDFTLPIADAGNNVVVCSDESIIIGTPAQPGNYYAWSPVNGISNSGASQTIISLSNTNLVLESHIYNLEVTDQYGCRSIDSIEVSIKPTPVANFISPPGQCLDNNSFNFSVDNRIASAQYVWQFGPAANVDSVYSPSPSQISFATAGDHFVSVYGILNGCISPVVSNPVRVYEMPQTEFVPDVANGCAPLAVNFNVNNPSDSVFYTWMIQGQPYTGPNSQWNYTQPGSYNVALYAVSIHGCVKNNFQPQSINVYPVPEAFFTTSAITVEPGVPLQFFNNSTDATIYQWDFGDGATANIFSPYHSYQDTGIYTIELSVLTGYGCADNYNLIVKVENGFTFYVPNAFTPNGDGRNDNFQGYGTNIGTYQMWIYDRWGKNIYYTENYHLPWDGRIESMSQNDTYVYRIVVSDTKGEEHVYIGDVSLVK